MENPQIPTVPDTDTPEATAADRRLANKVALFSHQPDDAWVDLKVVCAVCDRSPSSILRDVKAARLAPPIKIGPNAVRWRVRDVRLFLKGGR